MLEKFTLSRLRKKERFGLRIFDREKFARYLALSGLFFVVVVLGGLALSKNHEPGSDCLFCHDEVYQEGMYSFYMHQPFERKECDKCHLRAQVQKISDVADEIGDTVKKSSSQGADATFGKIEVANERLQRALRNFKL